MAQDHELTPEVQAALSAIYREAFERGRRKGYKEGRDDACALLTSMPNTPPAAPHDPLTQEASAKLPLSTFIEDLDLEVRTYLLLKQEEIHTIGDLLGRTENDLLEIRNLGHVSIKRLKATLREVGYQLPDLKPGEDYSFGSFGA